MKCSICKADGHNARTCPQSNNVAPPNDHALWLKFDNINASQADNLLKGIIDLKSAIAPDARGTFAKGSKQELPGKISEALGLQNQTNAPKKIN